MRSYKIVDQYGRQLKRKIFCSSEFIDCLDAAERCSFVFKIPYDKVFIREFDNKLKKGKTYPLIMNDRLRISKNPSDYPMII
jgi:hypothetical protein